MKVKHVSVVVQKLSKAVKSFQAVHFKVIVPYSIMKNLGVYIKGDNTQAPRVIDRKTLVFGQSP